MKRTGQAAARAPDLQMVQSGGRRPHIWDRPYALVTRRQKNMAIIGGTIVLAQIATIASTDWSSPNDAVLAFIIAVCAVLTIMCFDLCAWAFRPIPEEELLFRERRAADQVAVYLDDIGVSLPSDAALRWRMSFFAPSWRIETSCEAVKPALSGSSTSATVLSHLFREEFLRGCSHFRASATAVRLARREFHVPISAPSAHQRLAAYSRMDGRVS